MIGRAEDMHADRRRRDGTPPSAYLDQVTREQGGRRGRAQVRTPTGGLTWAVSRHATTRAGDPQPHDHVLIANVVTMGDARGGWKALDTALLRDHLHAATAIGRMAAAAKAVELGYGIEADPGPSGRLGGWAIAGIPKEAWEVHATRSAQIDAAVGPDASYEARSVAARATRDRKEHKASKTSSRAGGKSWPGPATRRPSWRPRWSGPASLTSRPAPTSWTRWRRSYLPRRALGVGEDFHPRDVVVAVAPLLHGLPVSILDTAVDRVLSHELAIALPLVAGAREPVWAAACVIEDERHIAELADAWPSAGPAVPRRGGRRSRPGDRAGPRLPSQRETGRSSQRA